MPSMIRKQVYLAPPQDRKLKRLAARRRCTEAEVLRDAIDHVPEPQDDVVSLLEREGLLAPKVVLPRRLRNATREALEARALGDRTGSLALGAAVLEERMGTPW